MRIPSGKHFARLNHLAISGQQRRTVNDLVALPLAAVLVMNKDFATTRYRNKFVTRVGHVAHARRVANNAGGFTFYLTDDRSTRCGTADMEGTHGELSAWLANRLRCNHANCLTNVHQGATTKVAPIAIRTQTVTGIAGQWRTHLDLIKSNRLNRIDTIFVQQRIGRVHNLAIFRINDLSRANAAEDTLAQRLDNFAAFDQRLHGDAV